MQSHEIRDLFDYNYWATGRILTAADRLTEEQYAAAVPGLSYGSIRATLVHTLAAEAIWRRRCLAGESPTELLREADYPTLELLQRLWAEEEAAMRDGLARLSDEQLAGALAYRTTNGTPMRAQQLWRLLVHVVNHGTQHRAEVAVALTAWGLSPGDVDYIVYMRNV